MAKQYIYNMPTGETREVGVDGETYFFKGGYYIGSKADEKILAQVNTGFPIYLNGKLLNTGDNKPLEEVTEQPEVNSKDV